MPSGWREMSLQDIQAFGTNFSIRVSKSRRYRGMNWVTVFKGDHVILRRKYKNGQRITINLETKD